MTHLKAELVRQIYIFAIFILNGCIIGILFDIFRILRKSFKTSDFITSLEDILFCMLAGAFLIYSIFIFNNGEIRLYVLLGLVIGLILYMLLFSKHMIEISVFIIGFLKKVFSFIIHIIITPIKIIVSFLKKPFAFIFINIRKISSNLANNLIKLLKKKKKNQKISKNLDHKEGI